MKPFKLLPTLGICCWMTWSASARAAEETDVQQRFAAMEQELGATPQVLPVAYSEGAPPIEQFQYTPGPTLPEPSAYEGDPACCDVCCNPVCRPSYWAVGVEIIPTQLHLTDTAFGRWPDEGGGAIRLKLGYENEQGYGIRARLWSFGQEATPPLTDVDVGAATFNLDFYKRFWGKDGDLAVGVSPVGAALSFKLPNDRESRFRGGGISLFADGFFNVVHFKKSDLGLVGRGQVSLLEGNWRDNTGFIVPDTDHDSMLILDAAWGLEFRRRFGLCEDNFWYIGVLSEIQQWDSEWMGNNLGSSAGFTGLNIESGIAW